MSRLYHCGYCGKSAKDKKDGLMIGSKCVYCGHKGVRLTLFDSVMINKRIRACDITSCAFFDCFDEEICFECQEYEYKHSKERSQ